MTRVRNFLQGLIASLAIIALVVGVPIALIRVFGNVYTPAYDLIRDGFASDNALIEALLKVTLVSTAWLAWAMLTIAVVGQIIGEVRGAEMRVPAVPRGFNRAAARLVATAALLVTAFSTSPRTAYSSPLVAADGADEIVLMIEPFQVGVGATVTETASTSAVQTTPTIRYTVEKGDHWWSLAEQFLNDGTRWPEIIQANVGRTMPDGVTITDSTPRPMAGWVLRMPSGNYGERPADVSVGGAQADSIVVVEKGDNLWNLTEARWGSTDMERIEQVAATNEIADPDLIYPGEVFDLSDPTAPPPAVQYAEDTSVGTDGDAGSPGRQTFEVELDAATIDGAMSGANGVVGSNSLYNFPPPANGGDQVETGAEAADSQSTFAAWELSLLLTGGVLGLLATRRRRLWRTMRRLGRPSPESIELERRLRAAAQERAMKETMSGADIAPEALQRLFRVLEAVAAAKQTTIMAVVRSGEGQVTVHFDDAIEPGPGWTGGGRVWTKPGHAVVLDGESDADGADVLAMVELGSTADGARVFVNLEALGTLEVGGPEEAAEAITNAITLGLASNEALASAALIGVGIDDDLLLHHPGAMSAPGFDNAVTKAEMLVGTNRFDQPVSALRNSGVAYGELWEPAIIIAGAGVAQVRAPAIDRVALVSAAPVLGPAHVLAPDGDQWIIRPLGIRLEPLGIDRAERQLLTAMLENARDGVAVEDAHRDDTIDPRAVAATGDIIDLVVPISPASPAINGDLPEPAHRNGDTTPVLPPPTDPAPPAMPEPAVAAAPPPPMPVTTPANGAPPAPADSPADSPDALVDDSAPILVRVFGSVAVETDDGPIEFGRSKSQELLVWLALHRDAPTRTGARGALWNFNIRETPFRNVVSDLRRSLDLAVPLTGGDTWLERTQTELLPLRSGVRTDAELLQEASATAREMSPEDAITTLKPVVELIRGMPFSDADYLWPDAEGLTSDLILLATGVIVELANAYREVGDIDSSLSTSGRGLGMFAGHEGLVAAHLHALDAIGDEQAIVAAWNSYQATLCDDAWGPYEPSPKLAALHQRIRERGEAFAPPGR